jgi:D-serine deaminase-like pyridoxal phosphate-dependent protein
MNRSDQAPARRRSSRRTLLIGAAGVAAAGAAALALRKRDKGGAHDEYFMALSRALNEAGLARPTLVVDRARMLANVDAAKATLAPSGLPARVVVKSLPAFGLIDPIAERLGTERFMVFNGAMLREMTRARPQSDLLLGKPLPARQAADFILAASADSAPATRPQWLIDTPDRLAAYVAVARAHNAPLRVNFEIDVGLHRGGLADAEALAAVLEQAKAEPLVSVSGLMGYDPHVPKVPNSAAAFARVQEIYRAAIARVTDVLGVDAQTLTLNTAGSPTYKLHAAGTAANEVAIGSAFVKPTDFDIDTLTHHEPASFIATPVLKALPRTQVPALESLSGLMSFWNPNSERAFFIYGGHWLARPVSPPGLEYSSLYGRSSNQELLTGSRSVDLEPDDYVFFRPTQSEAVFLQFGDIAMYEDGRIVEMASTFPVSA